MSLTVGYSTLLTQIGTKYPNNNVTADALIYNYYQSPNEKYGVRVEAPSISKEFSNGVPIGRDPTGLLFFGTAKELDGDCFFDLQYTATSVASDQRAFVITFYRTQASQAFAKFLARDPNGTVSKEITKGINGKWTDLKVGNVSMHVEKYGEESVWKITIPSLHKSATITQTTDVTDYVGVWGTLTFKDIDDIDKGLWVDYRYDRMVFTTSQYSDSDFSSYFIPPELKDDPHPLGAYNFSSKSVKWD